MEHLALEVALATTLEESDKIIQKDEIKED